MKTLHIIFTLLLIGLLFSNSSAQVYVYQNDTAYLNIHGHSYGNLQWQKSPDNTTWTDIPYATDSSFAHVPASSAYYRAKVTTGSCNPFYSNTTYVEVRIFQCGDTLYDYRDGQEYPTVLIGSQCWMAKNLNVGTMLTNGSETATNNGIIEKFCYNNDTTYCDNFGALYTWDEMMLYTDQESTQGICPNGWHIPSDQEWITLEVALGMDPTTASIANNWRGTDQGTQLKVGGSSGYDAKLSGRAIPNGNFDVLGQYEYMYSSTSYGNNAWRRCLRTGDATVGRWNTFPKTYGLSVRCVKN